MKLGIMQPYFFPYLGYFDLINYADRWIIFDTVQYIRHGWVNRNRILHPKDGWLYITVPVSHSRNTPIKHVAIANDQNWRQRTFGQLGHYKRHAPHYQEVMELMEQGFHSDQASIACLNVDCLRLVCQELGIRFDPQYLSEMDLDLGPINEPGDWALRISEALGATEYINPPGGVDIFDCEKFREVGIKLTFRRLPPMEYQCGGYEFIPNLSIVDVLMWNEPKTVKAYLEQHR